MSGNPVANIVIRTLEEDLFDFDTVVEQTGDAKREIADITMSALRRFDVPSLNIEDPDTVGNFTKLASAALKAVDAREVTSSRRVQSKVKLSEVRRSDNVAEVVTDVLIKMHNGTYTPEVESTTLDGDSTAIDAKYTALELPDIPDTILRTDPDDLTP